MKYDPTSGLHNVLIMPGGGAYNAVCSCGWTCENTSSYILSEQAKCHSNSVATTDTETIAEEASRIVYGDRERAYDDPNRNFNKLAHMWTGTILEKLKPGVTITARDVALMLVQLKISRESFKPNRENRVDGIGYWLCEDRVVAAEQQENNNDA